MSEAKVTLTLLITPEYCPASTITTAKLFFFDSQSVHQVSHDWLEQALQFINNEERGFIISLFNGN